MFEFKNFPQRIFSTVKTDRFKDNESFEKYIRFLIEIGSSVLRFNRAHSAREEAVSSFKNIKDILRNLSIENEILIEWAIPNINKKTRINLNKDFIELKENEIIKIAKFENKEIPYILTNEKIPLNSIVNIGDSFEDLAIIEDTNDYIKAVAKKDLYIQNKKGFTVQGFSLNSSNKLNIFDIEEIHTGVMLGVDIISCSFLDNEQIAKQYLEEIELACKKYNSRKPLIIFKMETKEGVLNLSKTIKMCDGISISRGDLITSMGHEGYKAIEYICRMCKKYYKPFRVSTLLGEGFNSFMTRNQIQAIFYYILKGVSGFCFSDETVLWEFKKLRKFFEEFKKLFEVSMSMDLVNLKKINNFKESKEKELLYNCLLYSFKINVDEEINIIRYLNLGIQILVKKEWYLKYFLNKGVFLEPL